MAAHRELYLSFSAFARFIVSLSSAVGTLHSIYLGILLCSSRKACSAPILACVYQDTVSLCVCYGWSKAIPIGYCRLIFTRAAGPLSLSPYILSGHLTGREANVHIDWPSHRRRSSSFPLLDIARYPSHIRAHTAFALVAPQRFPRI